MLVFYSEVIKKATKVYPGCYTARISSSKILWLVLKEMASARNRYLYCIIKNSTAGKITISYPSRQPISPWIDFNRRRGVASYFVVTISEWEEVVLTVEVCYDTSNVILSQRIVARNSVNFMLEFGLCFAIIYLSTASDVSLVSLITGEFEINSFVNLLRAK